LTRLQASPTTTPAMSSGSTSTTVTEPKEYPIPSQPLAHNIPRKPVAPTTANTYSPPKHHVPRTTQYSHVHTRWSLLRRRTRIFLICSALALLALILGLSIGLGLNSGSRNLPLPSAHGGPYSGDLTYYEPGLGACGITSTSSENIVAVSRLLFDAAQSGSDPNQNPLCGKKLRAKRVKEGSGERSVDLTVVDRCVGCKETDIDVSISVFKKLADEDLGRVTTSWSWLD
jgi:hypothetical protein